METTLVEDKKVEELVERTVQKHFKLAFENVEEVRKSPAVTLIRIEDRLNALEARIGRDMVTKADLTATRSELKQENANLRTELKEEAARTRAEFKVEAANNRAELTNETGKIRAELTNETGKIRAELTNETGKIRAELTNETGKIRTELATEAGKIRTELTNEIGKLRAEFKDEIWKMRLSMIVLAILIILNNPKVIELIGKLFSVFKP